MKERISWVVGIYPRKQANRRERKNLVYIYLPTTCINCRQTGKPYLACDLIYIIFIFFNRYFVFVSEWSADGLGGWGGWGGWVVIGDQLIDISIFIEFKDG